MKKFLIYLGHPAHYHNLKLSIVCLLAKGHKVKVVARGKDVLFALLEKEKWDVIYLRPRTGNATLQLISSIAKREWQLFQVTKSFKPNLLIGTDLVICHTGKLLGIPSLFINEDDSAAIPLMAKMALPYCTAVLAPHCCDQSTANHKKIGYAGYHELAYLHPNCFSPDYDQLPEVFQNCASYFLLRFASLSAHHDSGRRGISDDLAYELIKILSDFGQVFISSERSLSNRLEPFKVPIHPSEMHQVLAHCSLYIGDSQTMAAEAAVLGVPGLRYNDFVGELSYLEELEHTYGLTKGIKCSQPAMLFEVVHQWLQSSSLKADWEVARKKMLCDKIDVTPFWVETFEQMSSS